MGGSQWLAGAAVMGIAALIVEELDVSNNLKLGPIIHDAKRRVCSAVDITNKVANIFTTPSSDVNGYTKGKVSGSFPLYELWYVQSAVAVVYNPTSGTKDGVYVRIQALSGDSGLNTADIILAEHIQSHFHYCNYLGGIIIPYGVYVEVDGGGFDLNDVINFVVNYRKVLSE